MERLTVKICGLANGPDAAAVCALQPDMIGFVFWPGSPRGVTAEQVAAWLPELEDGVSRVGVFVDALLEEIHRTVDMAGLDIVQLHSTKPDLEYQKLNRPVWQVVHTGQTQTCLPNVDAFLIDSYSRQMPGGTGMRADWEAAAGFVRKMDTPVILAGGLTPDNVTEAIQEVQPAGVDVSSGVEAAKGKKDLAKVKAFIETCRNH